jgi:hypothetical protein
MRVPASSRAALRLTQRVQRAADRARPPAPGPLGGGERLRPGGRGPGRGARGGDAVLRHQAAVRLERPGAPQRQRRGGACPMRAAAITHRLRCCRGPAEPWRKAAGSCGGTPCARVSPRGKQSRARALCPGGARACGCPEMGAQRVAPARSVGACARMRPRLAAESQGCVRARRRLARRAGSAAAGRATCR